VSELRWQQTLRAADVCLMLMLAGSTAMMAIMMRFAVIAVPVRARRRAYRDLSLMRLACAQLMCVAAPALLVSALMDIEPATTTTHSSLLSVQGVQRHWRLAVAVIALAVLARQGADELQVPWVLTLCAIALTTAHVHMRAEGVGARALARSAASRQGDAAAVSMDTPISAQECVTVTCDVRVQQVRENEAFAGDMVVTAAIRLCSQAHIVSHPQVRALIVAFESLTRIISVRKRRFTSQSAIGLRVLWSSRGAHSAVACAVSDRWFRRDSLPI
jgi:hypothetical protein